MPRCIRRALTKLAAVVVLVVAVLAVAKFGLPGLPFGPSTTDRSHAPILHEVTKLERLTAAEGRFSVVVDLETGTDGVPAVLAGERSTMVAVGTVPAVVDLIDHDETRVTGRERGLLTRLGDAVESQPVDDAPLYRLAGDRLTAAAVESDLLADARESTTATMSGLVERLGYARVSVQFDEIPANSSPTRKANP